MRLGNGAALVLIASAALLGCTGSNAEETAAADAAASPELAAAEQRTLDIRAEAAGLVEPIATVEIKSKASGEVTNVLVESGQEVRRGTMLVEIEPRDVRNALSQAQADLEVARARATTSQAQFNRVQELRKANVATEQELESAQLEQANAQAALVKARVNVELAQERMNDVTIKAPMDGMIIEKTVEPGVIISSASGSVSGGTTLLKMADLAVVQVRALVDQTDIGRVAAGQTARVSVEAYPNRPFDGTVVKIEPQAVVDQNVTMFPVLIQLQNPERLLKPGMNTEVNIEIARRPNAVVIPNDAVVGVRDGLTTAVALGMSEEQAQEKLDAMRNAGMGGGPSGPTASTPSAVEGPTAARPAGQQGAAPQQNGQQQGAQQAANGQRPQMSAECTAIMQKSRAAREKGEQLPEADRAKARDCFSAMRGQGAGGQQGGGQGQQRMGANAGGGMGGMNGMQPGRQRRQSQTRPGIVFVPGPNGPEPRSVMLGYSDFDYTEVLSGIKPGEQVYLVTAARLLQQQKENDARMRARMGGPMPGMQNQPAAQPGRGGQGGGGGAAPRGN